MTPDDPAPDEEFALAVAQKAQVRVRTLIGAGSFYLRSEPNNKFQIATGRTAVLSFSLSHAESLSAGRNRPR